MDRPTCSELRAPKNFTTLIRDKPLFSSMEELHEKLTELLGNVLKIIRREKMEMINFLHCFFVKFTFHSSVLIIIICDTFLFYYVVSK